MSRWMSHPVTHAVVEVADSQVPFYSQGGWQELEPSDVEELTAAAVEAAAKAEAAMSPDATPEQPRSRRSTSDSKSTSDSTKETE